MTPHHITMLRSAGYYVAAALITYGLHNYAPEYQGVSLPILLALLSVLQVSLGYEAGKKLGVESVLSIQRSLEDNAVSATLIKEIQLMSPTLQKLADQVKANGEVVQSAVTLVHGLADQVLAAKDDPAAIEKLCSDLKAQADTLGEAVKENTPSANDASGSAPAATPAPADTGAAPAAPAPTDGSTPTT